MAPLGNKRGSASPPPASQIANNQQQRATNPAQNSHNEGHQDDQDKQCANKAHGDSRTVPNNEHVKDDRGSDRNELTSINKASELYTTTSNNNNKQTKSIGQKKDTKKAKNKVENYKSNKNSTTSTTKPYKSLVEELKLFQNSNLLNQQDPLEQLHQQLNELIKDDGNNKIRSTISAQQFKTAIDSSQTSDSNNIGSKHGHHNHQSLSSSNMHLQTTKQAINLSGNGPGGGIRYNNGDNIFTIKKGVLWQQQNYDKFRQRLFSRWKKRYFILTTDYLVCFKRSSSKVGRSEMGKFLYKVSSSRMIFCCCLTQMQFSHFSFPASKWKENPRFDRQVSSQP